MERLRPADLSVCWGGWTSATFLIRWGLVSRRAVLEQREAVRATREAA